MDPEETKQASHRITFYMSEVKVSTIWLFLSIENMKKVSRKVRDNIYKDEKVNKSVS